MTLELPEEIRKLLAQATNLRAKRVVEHIAKHGFVTTEQLTTEYGYTHAPRAARDVRELGIPLQTRRVMSSTGKSIAAYYFGDLSEIRADRLAGRTVFSKAFKNKLVKRYGAKCAIYNIELEERYLQIDHRIPYEVAGEMSTTERDVEDYMLLSGSANRAKSWSCEHCENWKLRLPEMCQECYWAHPEEYKHIAMKQIRRVDITWEGEEARFYEKLKATAEAEGIDLHIYLKLILNKAADD